MTANTYEIDDLIDDAIDELKDWMKDNPGQEPHDSIFEIADSSVPVYNYDIIQYAANNISIATNEPELGPAFDGSPTPVNIIAANIFEAIQEGLWEYYNDHQDDDHQDEEETEEE